MKSPFKKLCSFLLSLSMLLCLVPRGQASAAEAGGFKIENGVLLQYTGGETNITVPAGVTEIGEAAFFSQRQIRSVVLPEGLQIIGFGAFTRCSALESINIPSSVRQIRYEAFYECSALKSIDIPVGVTRIPSDCFYACKSLTGVKLPAGLQSIEFCGFNGCSSLQQLTIPDTVTYVGYGAFTDCSSLRQIDVNTDKLTDIGPYAFSSTPWESSLGREFVIFNHILVDYLGSAEQVTVPDGVTRIGSCAFQGYNCKKIVSVTIPESVTSIGSFAFGGCVLSEITVPAGVKTISRSAFGRDPSRTTVRSYTGSEAEAAAKRGGYPFVSLGEAPDGDRALSTASRETLAVPNPMVITINGKEIRFGAYNIDGQTCFKLRDIAYRLEKTGSRFDIDWYADHIALIPGGDYESIGTEMRDYGPANKVCLENTAFLEVLDRDLRMKCYNIDGYNYFPVRSLADILYFQVDWNAAANTVAIRTL